MAGEMVVVYKGVAHPWLADVMGHMTTRHYVAMFDDASYHFLHQVFGWDGNDAERGVGWADVKHVIEYGAEVGTGDLLEIRAGLRRVGGKSITAVYEMYNLVRKEVSATLESTCVLFDTHERTGVPLSDEMRLQAASFLLPEGP